MEIWDIETKNKDCSLSVGNPGFCRLATMPTFDGGMFGRARLYGHYVYHISHINTVR